MTAFLITFAALVCVPVLAVLIHTITEVEQ